MNTATAFSAGLAAAIALAAMAQAATPTASEHSANNILPGCRFLVSPKPATITSDVSGWSVGLCSIEFLPCLFLRPGGGDGSSRSIAMVDLSRFLFLGVLGALLLTACTALFLRVFIGSLSLFPAYRPGTTRSQSLDRRAVHRTSETALFYSGVEITRWFAWRFRSAWTGA